MKLEIRPATFYPRKDFFVGYEIPLRIIQIEQSPAYPSHCHDFIELVLVEAGSGVHTLGNNKFTLQQGDVFLINRGTSHSYTETENLFYVNVLFDERLLNQNFDYGYQGISNLPVSLSVEREDSVYFRLSAFGLRELKTIITKIDQECLRMRPGYAFLANAYFMQLWGSLMRMYGEKTDDDASSESRIRRIIDFIERDPSIDISTEEMATDAGTCTRNFRRLFRKHTGVSPVSFINESRIKKAQELLRETDKPVTQIAALVGYQDSNYFARQFHQVAGCSPREYRAQSK